MNLMIKEKKYIKILNHSNSERSRKQTRLEECKRYYPRDLWIVQKCTLVWEALCDKAFRLQYAQIYSHKEKSNKAVHAVLMLLLAEF